MGAVTSPYNRGKGVLRRATRWQASKHLHPFRPCSTNLRAFGAVGVLVDTFFCRLFWCGNEPLQPGQRCREVSHKGGKPPDTFTPLGPAVQTWELLAQWRYWFLRFLGDVVHIKLLAVHKSPIYRCTKNLQVAAAPKSTHRSTDQNNPCTKTYKFAWQGLKGRGGSEV